MRKYQARIWIVQNAQHLSNDTNLSDQALEVKERSIKLINKSSSPKIQATFQHSHVTLLVDEGSNHNASKHQLKIVPSSRKATAAGNNNLNFIGKTEHDVVVDTRFGSKRISINLGRITMLQCRVQIRRGQSSDKECLLPPHQREETFPHS